MKSAGEIGLKITAATREYYRYTGVSAEMERRGMGSSRPELAWTRRVKQQVEEGRAGSVGRDQSKEKSRK
jgi:hypothetical protein